MGRECDERRAEQASPKAAAAATAEESPTCECAKRARMREKGVPVNKLILRQE